MGILTLASVWTVGVLLAQREVAVVVCVLAATGLWLYALASVLP